MNSILFILPVSTQPRFSKRIRSYLQEGYTVKVASFQRDYFNKNTLPEEIDPIMLDKVSHGKYLRRIPILMKNFFSLIKLSRGRNYIYIFSVDVFLLLGLFGYCDRIIFEIGDIRKVSSYFFVNYIFDVFYKMFLRKSHRIVVTSDGFKTYLMNKYGIEEHKIEIIENKFTSDIVRKFENDQYFPTVSDDINLGVIGLLRYRNLIAFLEAFNYAKTNVKIHIFGGGPLEEEVSSFVDNERVFYYGQFKYPDDLQDIYQRIDISFTMYDVTQLNVRLALPNKLYESMYFKRPIIVTKGTYLEEIVNRFGIGFSWDQDDMHGLIKYLSSKTFLLDFEGMRSSFSNISTSDYCN